MSNAITVNPDAAALAVADAGVSPVTGAWSDWVGVTASIGCAIHCAAMPFVIAYLPALGLSFLADEAFHKWMAVGCFVIALVAFVPGLRKHGRWAPVSIAIVGLSMITTAAFGFAGECCPSCVADGAAGNAAGASPVAVACTDQGCELCQSEVAEAAAPVAAACTDAGCTLCPSEGADTRGTVASTQAGAPWVGWVAPWMTPVGGIVLVSAHLLNRRYGCLCGCCGNDPSEGTVG